MSKTWYEKHRNGSELSIPMNRHAERYVKDWRAAQDAIPVEEAEKPKVTGSTSYFSGAIERDYESRAPWSDSPTVPIIQSKTPIGFQMEEK